MPVSVLRARGGITEIGIDDLAMTGPEARSLLVGAGLELDDERVDELVGSHRGMAGGPVPRSVGDQRRIRVESGFTFTGDDRFVGDYLRSEFLHRVSRADVSFLTRTSILERMSGSLADVVTGRTGSGQVLDRLERRNLLVVPLDRLASGIAITISSVSCCTPS